MCGIAGVLYRDGSTPSEAVLSAMAETIAHRGPDGQGVRALPSCGLAHRRLSIIDLSQGASQPMSAAQGQVWIVFNGEIYNFKELKAELAQKGHAFKTEGDTEVALAAWLEWGQGAIERLDGMFAIALWDARTKELVLARDRTGKKPLYVYEDAKKVVFGSEIKAILAHPEIDAELSPSAVPLFLSHGYVPTPGTFYRRIRKVRPATFEVLSPSRPDAVAKTFWRFPVTQVEPEAVLDLRAVERRIRELFFAAVERRMVADVPLGAFLSGGVDSSLVVAAMAKLSPKPVKTFSIGFEGYPDWDETKYAAMVSEHCKTEHTFLKLEPKSFDAVEKLAWHFDEPFGDSSCLPTYAVSKLTREHVTVALTGDGGDELFCGYPRFMATAAAELVPSPLRLAGRLAVRALPPARDARSLYNRGRRFASQATKPLGDRLRGWVSLFTDEELAELLTPEALRLVPVEVLGKEERRIEREGQKLDELNRALLINAQTYLLDDLNVKVDRASMAASLETRAPFLDTALMDYVSRLPGSLKLHRTTFKWILKRALGDLVPEIILTRKKMGFGVPLGAWFRGELASAVADRLLSPSSPLAGVVRPDTLRALVEDHTAGRRDLGLQLWGLWTVDQFLSRRKGA
jgi:asparagine synthase (glutamine-hydrolysing)